MINCYVAVPMKENVKIGDIIDISTYPRTTDLMDVKNLHLPNNKVMVIAVVELDKEDSTTGIIKNILDARCFGINTDTDNSDNRIIKYL